MDLKYFGQTGIVETDFVYFDFWFFYISVYFFNGTATTEIYTE